MARSQERELEISMVLLSIIFAFMLGYDLGEQSVTKEPEQVHEAR